MKNLATLFFFFSLAIANLQAQDVLLFLESTYDSRQAIPLSSCMQQTNAPNGQHPAYWAAFVQQGNVAPLELVCKTGFTIRQTCCMIAGVFGLLILGGFVWWKKR